MWWNIRGKSGRDDWCLCIAQCCCLQHQLCNAVYKWRCRKDVQCSPTVHDVVYFPSVVSLWWCQGLSTFEADQLSTSSCYHPPLRNKSRRLTGHISVFQHWERRCVHLSSVVVCMSVCQCAKSFCLVWSLLNSTCQFLPNGMCLDSVALTGCGPLFESRDTVSRMWR